MEIQEDSWHAHGKTENNPKFLLVFYFPNLYNSHIHHWKFPWRSTLAKPKLTVMGHCSGCNQTLNLKGKDWLPDHSIDGVKCRHSKYSPAATSYALLTDQDAQYMAELIVNDTTHCLQMRMYNRHSLACGDGDNCEEERNKRAQALAEYVLRIAQSK